MRMAIREENVVENTVNRFNANTIANPINMELLLDILAKKATANGVPTAYAIAKPETSIPAAASDTFM
ncbi:hypothetical protein D3C75_1340330 [compost metagenome]